MLSWPEFKIAAPEIAVVGESLLFKPESAEVAILATVDRTHQPWVAPVCPIFTLRGLYVLIAAATPKANHLLMNTNYALHALLGADDLEFQIGGTARTVSSAEEREEVISAIPFPSFDAADPMYELQISRALIVTWPEPGKKEQTSWQSVTTE